MTLYDTKWAFEQAQSSIDEEDFGEVIDNLEDSAKISKTDARTIKKLFKE